MRQLVQPLELGGGTLGGGRLLRMEDLQDPALAGDLIDRRDRGGRRARTQHAVNPISTRDDVGRNARTRPTAN
jgi:hypothetical protein